MSSFQDRGGELFCEEVPVRSLAEKYGTPLYVYSKAEILSAARSLKKAFAHSPTLPCYAVKANSNLNLLKILAQEGFGADVVSQGELLRAQKAGFSPETIVFSGVGKREEEILCALDLGILSFQVESLNELLRINTLAAKKNTTASVCLRVNPNIDAKTNPHIATGLYSTKFGIAEKLVPKALALLKESSHLKLIGLSCHLGSQITSLSPFRSAARRMAQLSQEVKAQGFNLSVLDFGGGLGISYEAKKVPSFDQYAKAILPTLKKTGLRILLEPGRSIIAQSGVLVTQVIDVKHTPKKQFVVVDAGMNDLIRPVLYGAYHEISPVRSQKKGRFMKVDVVGPICESADYFAKNRKLKEVVSKDLLVIWDCGAYGLSMASHYNSRPKPAEVLVDKKDTRLIRRREPLDALWEHEVS